MQKLLKYLKPYRMSIFLGLFFKFVESLIELMIPLLMADLINDVITNKNYGTILPLGGLLSFIILVSFILAVMGQYFAAKASTNFGNDLRKNLYKHINTLSYSNIDGLGTSTLINRLTYDIQQIQTAVFMAIRIGTRAPFMAVGSFIMAVILDVQISLVFLVCIPIVGLTLFFIMKKTVPMYKNVQEKLDNLTIITRENISGARIVRAFSRQEDEEKRFLKASADYKDSALKVGRLSAVLNPVTSLVMQLGIAAILVVGGYKVNAGSLVPAQLAAFITYILQILLAMTILANLIVVFIKAYACGERVQVIFSINSEITEKNNTAKQTNENYEYAAEFDDVSYSYADAKVLSGINLKIKKGECTGIIGGTGSGKTTLINLLPRFYDVSGGSVKVNGINVKDYDLKILREIVCVVPQKSVLFKGSLRENIAFGSKVSDEEINYALKVSQSEFALKYPEKLDTVIEKEGKNLSGGQRQRLAIARAIVKKPQILILDDSSSAIDYSTDASLFTALRKAYRDMTVIIISQRVYSINRADKIIVLDDGKISGTGTHKELLGSCRLYTDFYNSQTKD